MGLAAHEAEHLELAQRLAHGSLARAVLLRDVHLDETVARTELPLENPPHEPVPDVMAQRPTACVHGAQGTRSAASPGRAFAETARFPIGSGPISSPPQRVGGRAPKPPAGGRATMRAQRDLSRHPDTTEAVDHVLVDLSPLRFRTVRPLAAAPRPTRRRPRAGARPRPPPARPHGRRARRALPARRRRRARRASGHRPVVADAPRRRGPAHACRAPAVRRPRGASSPASVPGCCSSPPISSRATRGTTSGPPLLILAGVAIVARWSGRTIAPGATDEDVIRSTAVFGGPKLASTAQRFEGAWLTAIFGGITLDLRDARPAPDGASINATVAFGGIDILVPKGWRISVRSTPIFGGLDDKTDHSQPPVSRRADAARRRRQRLRRRRDQARELTGARRTSSRATRVRSG